MKKMYVKPSCDAIPICEMDNLLFNNSLGTDVVFSKETDVNEDEIDLENYWDYGWDYEDDKDIWDENVFR